jgi:hypothetical protein
MNIFSDVSFNIIDHEDVGFNIIDELQQDNQFNIYNTEEIQEFFKNNVLIKNNISNTNNTETNNGIENISKLEYNNIFNIENVTTFLTFQEIIDCSSNLQLSPIGKPKTLSLLIDKKNTKNTKNTIAKSEYIEVPEFEWRVPTCGEYEKLQLYPVAIYGMFYTIFDTKFKLIRQTPTTMLTSFKARALYYIYDSNGYISETGEHIFTDTSRIFSNIGFGFELIVPSYNITIPSLDVFTIRAERDCEDLSPICIPNCKWEHPCYRSCGPRIFGRRICVKICSPIPIPTKSNLQLKFEKYTLPSVPLVRIPEVTIKLDINIIPEFEFDQQTAIKVYTDSFSVSEFAKGFAFSMEKLQETLEMNIQFEITKLIIGFTFRINKIQFQIGQGRSAQGINLTNLDIPIIEPFDICGNGKKLVSKIDSEGNLSLWYLLGTKYITLYEIIKKLIIPGTPEIIINFCKQTEIEFKYGLLFCPKEPVKLSFVVLTSTELYPFRDLNKINIPDIPKLDVPDIPRIPGLPIPKEWINSVNNSLDTALNRTRKNITEATRIIKDILENYKLYTYTENRVPLIVATG